MQKGKTPEGKTLKDIVQRGKTQTGITQIGITQTVDVVLDCKILTQDEAFRVVKFYNSVLSSPVGFPENKRSFTETFQRCRRFGSVEHPRSGYPYLGKKDCLVVTVDKDISLHGVTLCGSTNNTYSVTIRVTNLENTEDFIAKSGDFASTRFKAKPFSYYGFDIYFYPPFILKRNVIYSLEAQISGANSCLGQKGERFVVSSGVKFNFDICCPSNNGTNVERGQFPEILFTVCNTVCID